MTAPAALGELQVFVRGGQLLRVSNRPGRTALVAALADRRRHLGALAVVIAVFGVAWMFGSRGAYYAASLVAFTVWMVWFVLTTIEWLRRADF